jgi:protein gp37
LLPAYRAIVAKKSSILCCNKRVINMHDIWNPWHGCKKIREGCDNCYMYFLDRVRDRDGAEIYCTQNFDYPLKKNRKGNYKIQSGEMIRVCMTSDFFWKKLMGGVMRHGKS